MSRDLKPQGELIEQLVQAVSGPTGHLTRREFNDKCYKLSMEWPSLAAAIGEYLDAYGFGVPGPFRNAANVVRQERKHSTR